MKKIRVGIIFGGKSAEHEVSLRSAKNVYQALDKNKYEPVLIGVSKKGQWLLGDSSRLALESGESIKSEDKREVVSMAPESGGEIAPLDNKEVSQTIDVAFPILHGPFGEDGTVQGLLKLADIPFVGAGVLGSAVGMDKDVMKRLLRDAGIPISKFVVLKDGDKADFDTAVRELGLPLFIKPANLGSSVGISKVRSREEFDEAVALAFQYDTKILLEEFIKGREIECSVLGNDNPTASIPGEIITSHDFYSYEAKYLDENGAELKIPADLPPETVKHVQELAVKTFKALCCEGMGRVDLFLKENGEVYANEINTIPGFTSISMYPKLWEASGISYAELIDKLIQLALQRFAKEKKLKTSFID